MNKAPNKENGKPSSSHKGDKVVATNRKALHEYHIDERFEAGIALTGTEVKSLRQGKATLGEAYATADRSEIFLYNMHIPPYEAGNRENHEPTRKRKLLLHRQEIRRLENFIQRRGYTLIPLKLYFHNGYAKMSLGLARGKKSHDKRNTIAERDAKREMARALRRRTRGDS